jgi:pimeloyl-ACP methyl ester carboxylesterase
MSAEVLGEGLTIHYEEMGSGPDLVFARGWTMSSRSSNDSSFPEDRVVAVDLRGHAASERSCAVTPWRRLPPI